MAYCEQHGVSTKSLSFDLRPSEVALPAHMDAGELDLVLIDGRHGFPVPIIDWFYGAGRLRRGGIVIIDDLQLPQVSAASARFLRRDPRWEPVRLTPKWVAYRRASEGPLGEERTRQTWLRWMLPGTLVAIRQRIHYWFHPIS